MSTEEVYQKAMLKVFESSIDIELLVYATNNKKHNELPS
jgi:hypothetical protein